MRSTVLKLILLAGALVALVAPAPACDGHAFVQVALAPLPPELEGMHFEFHKTMGAQLVVDNPTPRTLEILDANGVAFARVRRDGVEANLAAPAWYTSYGPAAVVPAELGSGTPARWTPASRESNYGWFESRADPAKTILPPEIIAAGKPVDLGAWSVPLRVDGRPVALRGTFRYEPPAGGTYRARLTSPHQLAPGVRVRLLPGEPPGLLLENSTSLELLILGAEGEPFLRIGSDGVDANLHSPTWQRSGRGGARTTVDGSATPRWQQVSSAGRYSWIEPRAHRSATSDGTAPPTSFTWSIPAVLGGERISIDGETVWTSTQQLATAPR